MSDLIHKWATLDGLKTQEFNLKSLPPYHEPSIELLQQHAYFWQSDNSRFWFYKEDDDFMSFPAVLLSDTGYYFFNILKIFFFPNSKKKSQIVSFMN